MSKRHQAGQSQQSLVARIEEVVLSSSGVDAFELVFALAVARLFDAASTTSATAPSRERTAIVARIDEAARRVPGLDPIRTLDLPDAALAEVLTLLDAAALGAGEQAEALDAIFEQLVNQVGKGQKGQFFTPRHVVEMAARALHLRAGERVLDPACGSGAFLVHARAQAAVETWGFDVDARALRVARLLAVVTGADPSRFVRADSLRHATDLPRDVDAILSNPPFAGAAAYEGYELAASGRKVERDALFVERCVGLLRPGGRLAIVLPHSKVAAAGWSKMRRWLHLRARVFAVVSLPRETFLPHTSQKTAVVFAKKRALPRATVDPEERVLLAVSERAGKDASGAPLRVLGVLGARDDDAQARATWRTLDHDLAAILAPLASFLVAEGFDA